MNHGGLSKRGFQLAVLLLLVSMALAVPLIARAQGTVVFGVVTSCADSSQRVASLVTLVDVHGKSPDGTFDASAGTYQFSPTAGQYKVKVAPKDFTHFTNETSPFQFNGTTNVRRDVCVVPMPSKTLWLNLTIRDSGTSSPISGAMVTAFNGTRMQPIAATVTTNATGKASFRVWSGGRVDVKVEADMYQPRLVPFTIAADTSANVTLDPGRRILVVVTNAAGGPMDASQGLAGVMVNNALVDPKIKILRGTPVSNTLDFDAYDGSFTLIVDANGMAAARVSLTVSGINQRIDVQLAASPQELFQDTIVFNNNDWNNVTVYRNVTLLPDSVFPSIGFAELRDLRWQFDLVFGDGDGVLLPDDLTNVNSYLQSAGPFHTILDGLLDVNGRRFIAKTGAGDFVVTGTPGPGANFTIASRTNYALRDPTKPIELNKPKYFVNVTTIADKDVPVYQNNTVFVELPRRYEKTSETKTGNVTTRGFTRVEVDSGVDTVVRNPRVNTVVEFSLTGIARAEVEGPIGKVSVRNADQDKYLAWVMNGTAIVFSANKTTDRQNRAINVNAANFTWRFVDVTDPGSPNQVGTAYGIWTTFNFGPGGGNFTVNLTVTQVNPDNRTYRDINATVDNVKPTAHVKTSRTGSELNPANLTVKEDEVTTFNAGDSSDLLWGTLAGRIAEYNWDFDADGIVDRRGTSVSWNYSRPGRFNATLYVVDSVGHRSENRTINVTAQDTTAPDVRFVILDPENEWRETSQLTEGKEYFFNASATTDNSLNATEDNVNLTYKWEFGDNTTMTGSGSSLLNVSHTYVRFGSYKLVLTATDASENNGTARRDQLLVQANTTAHPDLSVVAGTLKVTPTPSNSEPQEGQEVHFSLNITNAKEKATARDLRVQFALIEGGSDVNQTISPIFRKADGSTTTEIAAGENVTVEFVWRASDRVGNFSLKIKVFDGDEPDAWVTSGNEIRQSLVLREAWWKFWAIVGVFVFIVVGLPIIYYVVRKVRAGELALPRRRKEKAEEEEGEEEEEGGPRKRRL